MKRFCVLFAVVILLLPAVSSADDVVALQDGWFNGDPLDDSISRAPHALKHSDDESQGIAVLLRLLDSIQTVALYMLPFLVSTGAATVHYAFGIPQVSIVRITGRSPPLS